MNDRFQMPPRPRMILKGAILHENCCRFGTTTTGKKNQKRRGEEKMFLLDVVRDVLCHVCDKFESDVCGCDLKLRLSLRYGVTAALPW